MKGKTQAEGRAGQLVIIGGAEDRAGECTILREFVRLAGGAGAKVVVVTAASEAPAEVGPAYVNVFGRLGAGKVRALDIGRRTEANSERVLGAIEEATGVFFTGGVQQRVTQFLGGTKADTLLHRRREEQGLVLGGTSAGATMMSSVMIVGGEPTTSLRAGMVELGAGMDFLPGVLIDQHFEERGRLRRLLSAVAQYPHELGLGIDEDTAVVVEGQTFRVIGRESVTVVDPSALTYTNLSSIEKSDLLAICGIKIHVLPAGYGFDLRNRVPLVIED